jgi:hypothetical protein
MYGSSGTPFILVRLSTFMFCALAGTPLSPLIRCASKVASGGGVTKIKKVGKGVAGYKSEAVGSGVVSAAGWPVLAGRGVLAIIAGGAAGGNVSIKGGKVGATISSCAGRVGREPSLQATKSKLKRRQPAKKILINLLRVAVLVKFVYSFQAF